MSEKCSSEPSPITESHSATDVISDAARGAYAPQLTGSKAEFQLPPNTAREHFPSCEIKENHIIFGAQKTADARSVRSSEVPDALTPEQLKKYSEWACSRTPRTEHVKKHEKL